MIHKARSRNHEACCAHRVSGGMNHAARRMKPEARSMDHEAEGVNHDTYISESKRTQQES